jgi:hypothetical protein
MSNTYKNESWSDLRDLVLSRDDYKCSFCGITDEEHKEQSDCGLSAHHIIPKDDGGEDIPKNLMAVCSSCHKTLEFTHGKAMSQMKADKSDKNDKEVIKKTYQRHREEAEKAEELLEEYMHQNPVFSTEKMFQNEHCGIHSGSFEGALYNLSEREEINTEWHAAVVYGMKEGVLDTIATLDAKSPYDIPVDNE